MPLSLHRHVLTLCLFATLPAFAQAAFDFLPLNFNQARERAYREDKLLMVYFSAAWCLPCQWMQEHTFQDSELRAYLSSNFLAIEADVALVEGSVLQTRFEVKSLPAILAFDANGRLIYSHEGSISANVLLSKLESLNLPAHHIKAEQNAHAAPAHAAPVAQLGFSRPALAPEATAPSEAISGSVPVPNRVLPHPVEDTGPALAARAAQYYTLLLDDAPLDYSSAIAYATTLERKLGTTVNLLPSNEQGFRIIVGRFEQYTEAQSFLLYLRRNNKQGSIIPNPYEQ